MWLKMAKYTADAVAVVAIVIYILENGIVRFLTAPFHLRPCLTPHDSVVAAMEVMLSIGFYCVVIVYGGSAIFSFVRHVFLAKEETAEQTNAEPAQHEHPYNTRSKTRAKKIK